MGRDFKRRYATKSRGPLVSALKRRANINPPLRGEESKIFSMTI
jgi:hypothetical protein